MNVSVFLPGFTVLLWLNQLLIRCERPRDAAKPYSVARRRSQPMQLFYNSSLTTLTLTSAGVITSAASSQ